MPSAPAPAMRAMGAAISPMTGMNDSRPATAEIVLRTLEILDRIWTWSLTKLLNPAVNAPHPDGFFLNRIPDPSRMMSWQVSAAVLTSDFSFSAALWQSSQACCAEDNAADADEVPDW